MVERLGGLTELTVIFPFSYEQARELAQSPAVRRLRKLHLVFTLATGHSTTDYKQQRAPAYVADISDEEICRLVAGGEFRSIENLTNAAQTIEIGARPASSST